MHPCQRPLALTEIYVDDYIQAAQGDPPTLTHIRQTQFHAIDDVFHPLHPADNPHWTEPMSVNKLCQGDTSWSLAKRF
jgi:hypothetical protein